MLRRHACTPIAEVTLRVVRSAGRVRGGRPDDVALQRLPPRRALPADAGVTVVALRDCDSLHTRWHVHRRGGAGQVLADPSEEVGVPSMRPGRVAIARVPAVVLEAFDNGELERRRLANRTGDHFFGEITEGVEHCDGRLRATARRRRRCGGQSESIGHRR